MLIRYRPAIHIFCARAIPKRFESWQCGGQWWYLSEEYAELVKSLWLRSWRMLTLRFFKDMLAMKAPQFLGSQQHDCQEFCSFLLDVLHEDSNRARPQPYEEELHQPLLSPAVASERAWAAHAKRHDSLIVDLFQGQLHLTIICGTCEHQSLTFTPFMFLPLPIPSGSGPFSLEACLRLFCKPEQML